jgi:hypothetical protein
MRWLLLAATLFGGTGCLSVDTPDGTLRCADTDMYPGRACPEGFHCAGDSRCYRGPQPPPDMSKTGCATVLNCELACSAQGCSDNCIAAASDKAVPLWNPVIACALNYCGGGTQADCNTNSGCRMCVQSVLQSGLGGAGACWSQIGPCLAIGNQ